MNPTTPAPATKRQQTPEVIANGSEIQLALPRDIVVTPTPFAAGVRPVFFSFDLLEDGTLHYIWIAQKRTGETIKRAVSQSTIPQTALTNINDATDQTNGAVADLNDQLA